MSITTAMRAKYAKRSYGQAIFDRYPPGGSDVVRCCDAIDRMEAALRSAQRQLTIEKQNEIERELWQVAASI